MTNSSFLVTKNDKKYRVHIYHKSGFIIIVTPQESFRSSSSGSLNKLSIIEGFDFFRGAA